MLQRMFFDFLLRTFDLSRDKLTLDPFALLHAQPRQPFLDPFAAELRIKSSSSEIKNRLEPLSP